MGRIEELNDIPADDVDQKVREFELAGAEVEKIKQDDGKYTIKASFQNGENH